METVGLQKHELPPTNQKRMVAFINHFIVSTVAFLNKFATDCENKFVDYEHKIQNLEASLMIVEAKLASIEVLKKSADTEATATVSAPPDAPPDPAIVDEESVPAADESNEVLPPVAEKDQRYEKYFKMIQFGVPVPAVKNKIAAEGLDPNYIDLRS